MGPVHLPKSEVTSHSLQHLPTNADKALQPATEKRPTAMAVLHVRASPFFPARSVTTATLRRPPSPPPPTPVLFLFYPSLSLSYSFRFCSPALNSEIKGSVSWEVEG